MAQKTKSKSVSTRFSVTEKHPTNKKKGQDEVDQEETMAEQYRLVIGQLKAAEARNRIRATRLRCVKSNQDEIDQIIAFQPNALSALRFEAFMSNNSSSHKEKDSFSLQSTPRATNKQAIDYSRDPLTQIERRRVQNLLLDDDNLLVNRTE